MNYVSPKLEAAAASVRTPADVLTARALVPASFGSIEFARANETSLMESVLSELALIRNRLEDYAAHSEVMADEINDLLLVIADGTPSKDIWKERIEDMGRDV